MNNNIIKKGIPKNSKFIEQCVINHLNIEREIGLK